jgi:hypothetical protein
LLASLATVADLLRPQELSVPTGVSELAWLEHVVMRASCGATIKFESWRKPSRAAVGDGR